MWRGISHWPSALIRWYLYCEIPDTSCLLRKIEFSCQNWRWYKKLLLKIWVRDEFVIWIFMYHCCLFFCFIINSSQHDFIYFVFYNLNLMHSSLTLCAWSPKFFSVCLFLKYFFPVHASPEHFQWRGWGGGARVASLGGPWGCGMWILPPHLHFHIVSARTP